MDYSKQYSEKLTTAEKAVSTIKSGDVVDYGSFNGKPVVCDIALANRHNDLKDVSIYSAVTVPPVPEVSKYPESFTYSDWHWTKLTRLLGFHGQPFYAPILYQRAPFLHRNARPRSYLAGRYGSLGRPAGGHDSAPGGR